MRWSVQQKRRILDVAAAQHGVVARSQLTDQGLTPRQIERRLESAALHAVFLNDHPLRGVYAVGSPTLTRRGQWMAAVLCCGEGTVLSHFSAAALLGVREVDPPLVEVAIPRACDLRPSGIRVLRRPHLRAADVGSSDGIPVTSPVRTLIDLATRLSSVRLEAAVNAADKLDLVDPETLRAELAERRGQRGVRALREVLDRRTFVLTDSELERRFARLARRAGLPRPQTGVRLNGFKVDFHWPDLGLVVETDGLRYHRTAAQQARDLRRDRAHARAGLTTLRFSHAEVRYEPDRVIADLLAVAGRYGPQQ